MSLQSRRRAIHHAAIGTSRHFAAMPNLFTVAALAEIEQAATIKPDFCIRANAPSRAASTGLSNGRKRRTAALSLRPCLWTSKVPLLVDLEGAAVGFAKVLRLDLAHCVAGDVAGHEHAFGLLVFREIARDSGLDLLFVDFCSGLRSHNRHHGLAEIGVRYANHGAFSDARHCLNGRFDLRGIDVVPARDDEVLGASRDVDVPLRIDVAEIPRDKESVGAEFRAQRAEMLGM